MLSQRTEEELTEATRQELFSLGARLVTFEMNPEAANFSFADYVTAASLAEGLAQGEASCLVVMAADTLVLQPPSALLLPPGKSLGACPVHLKLLGSGCDEPVDDFWSLVYQHCHVDVENIFSIQTVVDEQTVRAYFNAGLLVVRPERGLLRAWKADFDRLYNLANFEAFYRQSELYEIFMHQAVLAGSILSRLSAEGFLQLPFEVNYPLHLHSRVADRRRPASLSQLVTCRYEELTETFAIPEVNQLLQEDPALKDWLERQ
jgi:hypothetical protein